MNLLSFSTSFSTSSRFFLGLLFPQTKKYKKKFLRFASKVSFRFELGNVMRLGKVNIFVGHFLAQVYPPTDSKNERPLRDGN